GHEWALRTPPCQGEEDDPMVVPPAGRPPGHWTRTWVSSFSALPTVVRRVVVSHPILEERPSPPLVGPCPHAPACDAECSPRRSQRKDLVITSTLPSSAKL